MAKRETQGPQFVRYFGPVIDVLKDLGGSGRPAEVRDKVAELLKISEGEQNQVIGLKPKKAYTVDESFFEEFK